MACRGSREGGERPGLDVQASMSAYFGYRPTPSCTDADRSLISNIRDDGIRQGTPRLARSGTPRGVASGVPIVSVNNPATLRPSLGLHGMTVISVHIAVPSWET